MLLLIDTADVAAIERIVDVYPVVGVTTNPTLIAREKRPLRELLLDIRRVVGERAMLHAQVLSDDPETMVQEALRLRDLLGEGFHPKVPVTPPGIKAIRRLAELGFAPTATAVVSPIQALVAARAGAAFVAPYVNRLDEICGNGSFVVEEIAGLIDTHDLATRVLAASFKTVQQVLAVAMAGAQSATLSPAIFEILLAHPLTDSGVAGFLSDWEDSYRPGHTILDALEETGPTSA
jgi:fructose-6-phosphate aldolase 2